MLRSSRLTRMWCTCPLTTRLMYMGIPWACGLGSIRGGELDLVVPTFRSALASRSHRSSALAGDGTDGASAGASTVESSSAAILGPIVGERFITIPRLCMEIIEGSHPHVADTERAGLLQVADMRAHRGATVRREATRERRTASRAAIAGQPLTGAQ